MSKKLKSAVKKFWAVMLILSIMLTGIPSVTAFAAEDGQSYTDIDDSVMTTTGELFKIQYEPSSRWHAEAGYSNLFYDGTDHYSDTGFNEDYYEMKFIGTAVEIHGSKNVAHADCDVYIDGEYAGEVLSGLDSGATVHKQLLFEKSDLADEEHTLKVVRKSGDTKALQVDKIRIYHGELTATAITLNVETVKLGIGGTKQVEVVASEPWIVEKPEVEWTSADESIATVDENGLITAVSTADEKKETVITATVKGSDVTASVKVTVDPLAESMVAGIGDEKLLDTQLDYEELLNKNLEDSWSGTAWKGDTLNSKVIVLAKEADVHNLTVTASDFENEAGDVLASENISIKWLKEILAKEGRNMAGELKSYPDIIHKGGATDVDAESAKFAWVSMEIPEDTKPGTYTGTLTVEANELKKPVEFTYTIEVLDLVQPAPEATEIQIWQHPFSVANYYLGLGAQQPGGICNELDEDFYFTEQHFNLMRDVTMDYVSMGGHDWVANIVEEAWNHQSYYSDPSMVKWTKKADGSWEFDYTWYDAWVEFGIECGVIDPETGLGQIKCYSIVPWNNQVAYYDEASGTTVKESHTPGAEAWTAIWTPFLEDFMAHSKEKGWFDITYISMDERTIAQLEPTVDLIESITDENGESFKISSALNYAAPEYYDFTDRIHDISINLGYCSNQAQMNALAEHRSALGLKTTMYTCTGNYPNNFTISDPGDNYWQIWYTMTLGMDGFMRWAWDNYVYDMHGNITYRYWEPGDGWYIYPIERDEVGENYEAGFYSTPRYELFKQGIRDVAKAKYLMEQSDVIAQEIDELMGTLTHPSQGSIYGSAAPSSEAQRLGLHAETDRIYEKVTAWAKAYIENPENPELPKGANEDDSNDYPVEKLTATAGSEQASAAGDGEGLAEFVLDGDPATHHHSAWNPQASEDQLWIMLELEEPAKIEALRYLPRAGRDNGSVTQYEISYSMDGESWEIISSGTWPLNKEWKLAEFDEALEAKYIKLYAVDSVADDVGRHLSAAEIRLVVAEDEEPVEENDEVIRLSGTTRYETGYKVADALKEELGVEKFDAVVVATGKNFADALAGSYLAVQKNAPIILTNGKDDNVAQLHEYIAANVATGGKVYILGGEAAVPATVEEVEGYEVVRLSGKSRYDTNLAILEEAGIEGNEIIVATGKSFADSLSASAAKLPILLVKPGTVLNDEQKAIAETANGGNIYIIGGTGAVSEDIEAELTAYADVIRVSGKTRYETSVAVANTFFTDVEEAVIASGKNFPDGLCGGPLAAAMNAPLILTADGKADVAVDYMAEKAVEAGFVLGGTGALADETVVDVFALESADEIIAK